MTLGQIIDAVRDGYIRQFEAAAAEQARLADGVLTEVALRDKAGAPIGEGSLQLPMRLDLVPLHGEEPGDTVSVDSEARVDFDALEFLWGERLRVTLTPFWWDSLHARLSVATWEPLRQWFMKWFSADEDGDGEPIGVVHFLSDPEPAPAGHLLTLDLGTAPVEAFEELLDAIEAAGATSVLLGADAAAT